MNCEDLRGRIWAGETIGGEVAAHLTGCSACSGEFRFLTALRGDRPRPPADLRNRVLAAAMPAARRPRFGMIAAAAAVLLAAGVGFAGGWKSRPVPAASPEPLVVVRDRDVVREIEKPLSGDVLACIAIAGSKIYGKKVTTTYDNRINPTEISVDPEVYGVTMCPVARTLQRISTERPEIVKTR